MILLLQHSYKILPEERYLYHLRKWNLRYIRNLISYNEITYLPQTIMISRTHDIKCLVSSCDNFTDDIKQLVDDDYFDVLNVNTQLLTKYNRNWRQPIIDGTS